MPQLDITTYSSQIFWFFICFAVLYFFVSKIILPRIHEILKIRRTVINQDVKEANDIDEVISKLDLKTAELRKNAALKYQSTVEAAVKDANLQKEKILNDLKSRFEEMNNKSRQDIEKFLNQSQSEINNSISKLSAEIAKIIS